MATQKNKQQSRRLYTGSLKSTAQRDAVLGIQANSSHNSFQTHAFQNKFQKNTQTDIRWREAWRNPGTHLWSVVEYTKTLPLSALQIPVIDMTVDVSAWVPPKETAPTKARTVLPDVCFFDALHNCASFECAEVQMERDSVFCREQDWETTKHFTAMAAQEKQPFAQNGLPLPAISGRIMVDGIFSQAAHDMAKETKDIFPEIPDALKPGGKPKPGHMNKELFTQAIANTNQKALVTQAKNEVIRLNDEAEKTLNRKVNIHTAPFDQAITSMTKLRDTFAYVAKTDERVKDKRWTIDRKKSNALDNRRFRGFDFVMLGGAIGGFATIIPLVIMVSLKEGGAIALTESFIATSSLGIGAIPGVSYLLTQKTSLFQNIGSGYRKTKAVLGENISRAWKKTRALSGFRKDVKRLPEGPYKEAMQRLGNDAEVGFSALEAERACDKIKDGGSATKAERLASKAFALTEKQDMSDDMVKAMDKALNKDWSKEDAGRRLETQLDTTTRELADIWHEIKDPLREELKARYLNPGQKGLPSESVQLLLGPKTLP